MIRASLVLGLAVFVTIFVHEAAHYVAALLLGAPIGSLDIGLCGGNPCVRHPAFSGWQGATVSYAGGLAASICLAAAWALMLGRFNVAPRASLWACGLIFGGLAWYQLGNGLMEGLYHDRYVRGSLETTISIVLFTMLGIGLHTALTWRTPQKRQSMSAEPPPLSDDR